MKKSVLYICIVFIVAFLLGMLASGQIRTKKLKTVRTSFSEKEYIDDIAHIVHPTKEQWESIDRIMNTYGEKNSELRKSFSYSYQSNMDDLRKEINQILTKEQRDKIKEVEEARKKMFEEFMKHRNDPAPFERRQYDKNFGRNIDNRGQRPPTDRLPDSTRVNNYQHYPDPNNGSLGGYGDRYRRW